MSNYDLFPKRCKEETDTTRDQREIRCLLLLVVKSSF